MLDEITEKEISTREGLERIDYLLNELYYCYNLFDIDNTYYTKQYVIDYFHRLFKEANALPNIPALLETYPSPSNLKNDIESILETINDLYYKSEAFNINDEKINKMKILMNKLLDAVYAEIANRMCGD